MSAMIRKVLGIGLVAGWMLGLPGQPQEALPACTDRSDNEGLHWECSGEQLLGSLAHTLKLYAEHLTAVLRNPPRDIQLLLYDYKQEHSTMPISKSYRIYKEQLMLPTEEILNPWDFSFGGDGPIFFINRQSPETIYFLEAPKKDPDCEVDWWLYWSYLKSVVEVEHRWPPTVQETFAEDQPITQNIRQCCYLPEEQPIWKYLVVAFNSYIVEHPERYYDLNPIAQNRIFLLSERDMDAIDNGGNHWMIASELENYTPAGGRDMWDKIWHRGERGAEIIAPRYLTWEEQFENTKHVVGTTNLPSYTSEFPFEPYIKNNATLWRPQELGVELSPEFDFLKPWPFIDIPVQVELTEPLNPERLKADFPVRFAAPLEELRGQLEELGADPAILDIPSWRFEMPTEELPSGSYLVTVDGTLELTDPSQPASEVYFREIVTTLKPPEP